MAADPSAGRAPSYRAAGVDLARADQFKKRLAVLVEGTFGPDVIGALGGFGGAFAIGRRVEQEPIVVATADGVGTKLLVAQQAGRHDTIGQDLVHHCVDDLLAAFARPLFLLDYIATGELDEDVLLSIVAGLARGCRDNGIALLGGETAEMRDLYEPGQYDLVGFALGIAPRSRFDRPSVRAGDVVLGLASTGLHTNGYTLARRIFEISGFTLDDAVPWGGESWADVLLAVHRSYLSEVGPLLDDPDLHAVAHVTGGGFAGNLPRVIPPGLGARLDRKAWEAPPLFRWLGETGQIDEEEMYRVFNMGIGLCLIVEVGSVERIAAQTGGISIGHIVERKGVEWA
jgi:phosphoribosylformylglycinamidine cyclo-ligase